MKQNGKTVTRPNNRLLKKQYARGFADGYKQHQDESMSLIDDIRKLFGGVISKQLLDAIDAGIDVEVKLNTTGKQILDILRKGN